MGRESKMKRENISDAKKELIYIELLVLLYRALKDRGVAAIW
jgi:hypothetical protein